MTRTTRPTPVSHTHIHVIVRSASPYMVEGTTAYYFDYRGRVSGGWSAFMRRKDRSRPWP